MAYIETETLINGVNKSDIKEKEKVVDIVKSTPVITDPDYEGPELD